MYDGILIRAWYDMPWILYPNWFTWKLGQRCPELIGFRDLDTIHVSLPA